MTTEIKHNKPAGIGARHIAAVALAVVVAAVIVIGEGASKYASVQESLTLSGELSAMQSADRLNRYLDAGKNSLTVSAYAVDNMMKRNASSEEIHQFMVEESDKLIQLNDHDYTGLYGLIGGVYLDGVNWVPDDDFVPKERPWYTSAITEPPLELVFVDPYLDAQTNTVMMTVAERLSDGESVIALDFSLADMVDINKEIAEDFPGSESLVLNRDGVVVSHSDDSQIGLNYLEESDTLGSLIAHKIIEDGETQFEVSYRGNTYVVYGTELEGGWYSVSVINGDIFYQPLFRVLAISLLSLVGAIALIAFVFFRMSRRNREINDLNVQLSTIADVYESVYDIDLGSNTVRRIRGHRKLEGVFGDAKLEADHSLNAAIELVSSESSKPLLREFLNLSTLPDRMGGRKSMAVEYLDADNRWHRCRLIEAGTGESGGVNRAILATESIDEEKRSRDHLTHLAETDQLTSVYNRVCGERRIRELLESGEGGMFMLLDVDRFKDVNDRYGHRAGDRVLATVANCLKSSFRTGDVVARFGGDEFAAFAPRVNSPETGSKIINRLFDSLRDAPIEALRGGKVSVSVGVAFSPPGETIDFQTLYEQADQRTYESKKTAGNQVTFYGPEDADWGQKG